MSALHKWEHHSWIMEKIKAKGKSDIYLASECVVFQAHSLLQKKPSPVLNELHSDVLIVS